MSPPMQIHYSISSYLYHFPKSVPILILIANTSIITNTNTNKKYQTIVLNNSRYHYLPLLIILKAILQLMTVPLLTQIQTNTRLKSKSISHDSFLNM